jgi:hypothetical protein
MRQAPIPQRIPPLSWRAPVSVWTPLALVIAIGAPAALFFGDGVLSRFALVAGAAIYAMAMLTLGAAWALGRPPRTRREVVVHVIVAGIVAFLIAPFILTWLLALVANYEHAGAGDAFTLGMSMAMTPLALVLGLPITLATAVLFSLIALQRPRVETRSKDEIKHDVQPFR